VMPKLPHSYPQLCQVLFGSGTAVSKSESPYPAAALGSDVVEASDE
jgi:hypothetical protein